MGDVVYIDKYLGGRVMPVTINNLANTFLTFESMTPKKLQKLCYYAQAWSLALLEEKVTDGIFEAWIHGPVCPELYHRYKDYGWCEIPKNENIPEAITDEIYDFLCEVYAAYGKLSGDDLEALTHSELPWQEARNGFQPWEPSTEPINEGTMQQFYLRLSEEFQNE